MSYGQDSQALHLGIDDMADFLICDVIHANVQKSYQ
jgi:hypothetical protein